MSALKPNPSLKPTLYGRRLSPSVSLRVEVCGVYFLNFGLWTVFNGNNRGIYVNQTNA